MYIPLIQLPDVYCRNGNWKQPAPSAMYPQTGSEISVPLCIVDVQSFCSTQLSSNNKSMTALWPFS